MRSCTSRITSATSSRSATGSTALRQGRNVAIFETATTTNDEIVAAITSGTESENGDVDVFDGFWTKFGAMRESRFGAFLPVMVTLVAIWVYFGVTEPNFFKRAELPFPVQEERGRGHARERHHHRSSIGDIDLSAAATAGICAALLAVLLSNGDVPVPIAILAALVTGIVLSGAEGLIVAFVRVPSFVVTLAGLLVFQGLMLKILGIEGAINMRDPFVRGLTTEEPAAGAWLGPRRGRRGCPRGRRVAQPTQARQSRARVGPGLCRHRKGGGVRPACWRRRRDPQWLSWRAGRRGPAAHRHRHPQLDHHLDTLRPLTVRRWRQHCLPVEWASTAWTRVAAFTTVGLMAAFAGIVELHASPRSRTTPLRAGRSCSTPSVPR